MQMTEREQLLAALEQAVSAGEPVVLATVVSAVGSVYRRIGGRMLIRGDGSSIGAISGGCLEAELIRRSRPMLRGGAPEIMSFDTRDPADAVWGSGVGCQGLVDVLVEPLLPDRIATRLPFYRQVLVPARHGVLATLIRATDDQAIPGTKVLITESSSETEDARAVEAAWEPVVSDARKELATGPSRVRMYSNPRGDWQVCFEVLEPSLRLLVLGGGPDAMPVTELARALGWRVTVVDHRPAFADPERFPAAEAVICSEPEHLAQHLALDEGMRVVAMTHSFPRDLIYLDLLLSAGVHYIGLLGPRRRTERLLSDLAGEGKHYPERVLRCIHGPVGLDIGGETPEAIALSIIAEVQAVASGRCGGPMREREAPIHPPQTDSEGPAGPVSHVPATLSG
jgi:xanthine dehydrogenase accessory factor